VIVHGKENREATTLDKGHGRTERRTIRVTKLLSLHQKWKEMKRGFRMTRQHPKQSRVEVQEELELKRATKMIILQSDYHKEWP
jgi:hypothetical protein